MHIVIVSVALLFESSAVYYFFEYVNYFSIDKSRAAHLWVGCAKTVCPSSSGNNGAFVNDIRLDICKNQFKLAVNGRGLQI